MIEWIFLTHMDAISDHSLEPVEFISTSHETAMEIFNGVLDGKMISPVAAIEYRSYVWTHLAKRYAEKGWSMQLHMGVIRNTNRRAFNALGPDAGFDTIGDKPYVEALVRFLDELEKNDSLPKTVLYMLIGVTIRCLPRLPGVFRKHRIMRRSSLDQPGGLMIQKAA